MLKRNICLQAAAERATDSTPATEPNWLRPLVEKIVGEVTSKLPPPTPFCDFTALVRHLPMYGERTLRQLVKDKILPAVRPPGSRKLAFHIPSVEAALLRYQNGGIE
jgi:hypothetical protein